MGANSWRTGVGVNHVGAYQVSGRPFATGSVNCSTATKIEFPKVTRWIYVINNDNSSTDCRVGFSQLGVESSNNFFSIGQPPNNGTNDTIRLELKVSEIFVSGSSNIDVVAGLTSIEARTLSSSTGPSWSGSSGVG
tara:strand:+ start:1693 stop:2100 length:408 start_codon:yes stop_codon:yes gene_type:complete